MAVYTHITHEQLSGFLEDYDLGEVQSFEGIEEGVSNSNYHVFTDKGRYVLTLFEPHRVDVEDIPFFLSYAATMNEAGVPCPAPIQNNKGEVTGVLADRQATIVPFMAGRNNSFDSVTPAHCEKAGQVLAQMHKAAEGFDQTQVNRFGHRRMKHWVGDMGEGLNVIRPGLHDFFKEELAWQLENWPSDLPKGAVHSDYFPDNVLFDEDGEVSAVLDFHFACTDFFVYDLGIMINAWCFSENGTPAFEFLRYAALMKGYEGIRSLNDEEGACLQTLLRGSALRTSLARCEELLRHKEDDLMQPHDPHAYIARLEYWQND